ncbi:3683_t:CDS:2 [Ambispora leptoticha]|uniref:3683_t:CDS:1 n=1 Tax=Ambispora leptoticha TaxID=144679 RepID=A0A9N8V7M8_9GLOM|nr:3683_t:CDS:2 [Ambispora leptoticha]
MALDCVDYMDIDDEWTLNSITTQIIEFRDAAKSSLVPPAEQSNKGVNSKRILFQSLPPVTNHSFQSIIVVDTNFLLSHLAFVKSLIYEHAKLNNLVIIVPWIVLQELDGLKGCPKKQHNNNSQPALSTLAQTAINFLHNCLLNGQEGVRGQRLDENVDKAEKNDDKILDCCRYFKLEARCPVTLLSNDKNLCVKAMVHEIPTESYQKKGKGLDGILERILQKLSKMSEFEVDDIYTQSSPPVVDQYCDPQYDNGEENPYDDDVVMDDCNDVVMSSSLSLTPPVSNSEVRGDKSLYASIHAPLNAKLARSKSMDNYGNSQKNLKIQKNRITNQVPTSRTLDDINLSEYNSISEYTSCTTQTSTALAVCMGPVYTDPQIPKALLTQKINLGQRELVDKVISELESLLPCPFKFHFRTLLGENWTYVVSDIEPWSLSCMLKFVERYWISVFSEVFDQAHQIQSMTVRLHSFVDQWQVKQRKNTINLTVQEILTFLQSAEVVLRMVYNKFTETNFPVVTITNNWWTEFKRTL